MRRCFLVMCASEATLAELTRVLDRDKFDRYLDRNSRREFVEFHRRRVHLFAVADGDVASVDPPCRDSSDNMFLALSMVAQADVLISGDEDLLILNPWRGVPIVRAAEFLAQAK
jgi:putative PIN family toxin of toxin-antitoxin system